MVMPASRLLVVANRLPVTARLDDGNVRLSRASGGLATGLRSWHEGSSSTWIGWPGDVTRFTPAQRTTLDAELRAADLVPVHLSAHEIERYYEGFANQVLWPLCHYLVDRIPIDASGWAAYREANEKFAQAVVDVYQPGDLVWVHDYQLMLVPALLRARLPEARIGFFLHIPFPSSEVYRILPWRRELLNGLLGADLIGFHTFAYLRHFLTSLLHIEGIEAEVDTVRVGGRVVKAGVFPMGVDADGFAALARTPGVQAEVTRIRADAEGRRLVLGIDRLDYTKGIPRRLLAFERLFARKPELRDRVRYVQIAVPSREKVDSYRTFRRQVHEMVGRINGACTTMRSTPIHYMHKSVSRNELVALYAAADVMLVTPLRDGMNLVAKEFLASRVDGDGVLVLSEFAGAAAELGEAIVVNPYDVDALASSIETALAMSERERRIRMKSLRSRVLEHDVNAWVRRFAEDLAAVPPPEAALEGPPALADLRLALPPGDHGRIALLLDYDGTLVPIVATPELAAPDAELLTLLGALSAMPRLDVHVVSGRDRDTLGEWLGGLPVTLWAEHGFWHRAAPDAAWVQAAALPDDAWSKVLPIFEHFTASTPGSRIESKTASLAWHYRLADTHFGVRQAHELRMVLGDALSNQPLEVLEGKKVIEVRVRGISKAAVARRVLAAVPPATGIVAIGDDRTDEDLFSALPADAITAKVGGGTSRARYRIADPAAVRRLLSTLIEAKASAVAATASR
jgi:trehalose 6-phosphate synthase/phosphatase